MHNWTDRLHCHDHCFKGERSLIVSSLIYQHWVSLSLSLIIIMFRLLLYLWLLKRQTIINAIFWNYYTCLGTRNTGSPSINRISSNQIIMSVSFKCFNSRLSRNYSTKHTIKLCGSDLFPMIIRCSECSYLALSLRYLQPAMISTNKDSTNSSKLYTLPNCMDWQKIKVLIKNCCLRALLSI